MISPQPKKTERCWLKVCPKAKNNHPPLPKKKWKKIPPVAPDTKYYKWKENMRKPAEYFEWHNPGQEASSKCQLKIPLSLNSWQKFHQPVKIKQWIGGLSTILYKSDQENWALKNSKSTQFCIHVRWFSLHIFRWNQKAAPTLKSTFSCTSKSNWILSSVTILGDLPCFGSGMVAIISWNIYKHKILIKYFI